MKVATLSGIRGGTGTTSVVAALGFALAAQGKRVLMIDCCPQNLLRLHCSLPFDAVEGWARADRRGGNWQDELFQVHEQLFLLPHGQVDADDSNAHAWPPLSPGADWPARIEALRGRFDWILLDVPAGPAWPGDLRLPGPPLQIRVIQADAAVHALLVQNHRDEGWLLVNRYDPASQLQRDLLLLWNERLRARMIMQVIHEDEAMAAALAHKSPLGYFAADSLAARDVTGLATWCLGRQERAG